MPVFFRTAAFEHHQEEDREVSTLVAAYQAHASCEELGFVPLSEAILGRNPNHMAALSVSLHLRQAIPEVMSRYGSRI